MTLRISASPSFRKALLPVVIGVALAGVAVVGVPLSGMAWGADAPQAAPSAATVTVERVIRAPIVETVTVTGTLIPRQEILIGPEIETLRIVELLVEEGDRVEAGQVLARLSRETLDAQVAQSDAAIARSEAAIAQAQSQIALTQAQANFAATDLQRAQTLLGRGASTQAIVDQKTSAARSAQAQLQAARDALAAAQADRKNLDAQRRELMVRLSRTEVRTPRAGIVSRRTAKVGAIATAAGEPMFRIIADGAIELEGEVPEQHLLQLKVGQPTKVYLSDDGMVDGAVRLVAPEVDRATRLGKVRIALADSSKARIGAFARGVIELRRGMALTVPVSAIMYGEDNSATVQTVVDGVVKTKSVRVGLVLAGRAEIVSGLNEGEVVVARAGPFLRDGDAVAPKMQEATR